MSSAYDDNFTSSLLICITFISFYCLIPGSRIPNTVLNRSDESGFLCFVPDFRGKAFNFSSLSVTLAVGLS